jgi:hypothetical protein
MNFKHHIINKSWLLTMLLTLLLNVVWAQGAQVEAIDKALKAGNASGISRHFGQSVDITINNTTSTYSSTQGEQVLRDFFSKNPVRSFDVEHSDNSTSSNSTFTVGVLNTGNGKYKVYLSLRPKDGGYLLKEIRVEKF